MQLGEMRAVARFPVYLGVAQLVACYLGVVEAAGSSPVTQTRENPRNFEAFSELRGFFCVSENQMLGHYEGTIFLKSYKKIQQHTTKKPPTELTVFFYLFLYRRAIYEAKIHTSF